MPPGAIELVGTILTSSSEDNKTAVGIGWALILLGSFSEGGDVAFAGELNDQNAEIALYGSGQTAATTQLRANAGTVLRDTEMEAQMVVAQPEMASGLIINEFAQSVNLSAQRLGQLVVKGKAFADAKLNNSAFGSSKVSVNKSDILNSTGALSDLELRVVSNYLNLRNITVL